MRTPPESVRLVNQQINALSSLEHSLDILRHDITDAVDLATRRSERVRRRGGVVCMEKRAQLGVESCTAVGWERRVICARGRVGRQELALHLEEVGEGDAAALLGGGHDYEAQGCIGIGFRAAALVISRAAGGRVGDVMDEQPFMGVCQFLGLVVGDLGEDD